MYMFLNLTFELEDGGGDFLVSVDLFDWSPLLRGECDWSALRAAAEAILAWAAALGDVDTRTDFGCSLRKKRLPDGRSLVDSRREKAPSFCGLLLLLLLAAGTGVGASPSCEESGGEWNLTNASPYFSVWSDKKRHSRVTHVLEPDLE